MPQPLETPDPHAPCDGTPEINAGGVGGFAGMTACRVKAPPAMRFFIAFSVLGFAGILAVILWGAGVFGGPHVHRVEVVDASQPRPITFRAERGQDVSGVTLRVRGHLDGRATVSAVEGNWHPEPLTGDVDFTIYHDWFDPICTIDYIPGNGTAGSLTVELTFD